MISIYFSFQDVTSVSSARFSILSLQNITSWFISFFLVQLEVPIFHLLTFSLLPQILTPSFPLCIDHNTFFCFSLSFLLLSLNSSPSIAFTFKLFELTGKTDLSCLPTANSAGDLGLSTGVFLASNIVRYGSLLSSLAFSSKLFTICSLLS